jgi:DHA3 family tetracycline resistance protein-like MFS transporter
MKKFRPETAYYLRCAALELNSGLIITAIYAYLVQVMGLSPLQLLLIGTVIMVTGLLFEVPTGIVADLYSRRLSVIIGGVLIGVCYVLTGSFPFYTVALVAALIEAIGDTFVSGALDAWITDEVGTERVGQVFLRGAQVGSVAQWMGVALSILLATWLNYQAPIVLGGVLWLVLSVVLILAMPETGFVRPATSDHASLREKLGAALVTVRARVRLVQGSPVLLLLFTAELFVGAFFEGFFRIYRAHFLTSLTMPVLALPLVGALDVIVWFGIFDGVNSILYLAGAELLRRNMDLNRPMIVSQVLLLCYVFVLAGGLFVALAGSFAVAAVALLTAQLFVQLAQPVINTWRNQHISSDVRATVLSMSGQVNMLGQLGGGLGVGVVGNRYGIRAALVLASLFLAPVLALYAGSGSRARRALTTPAAS